MKESLKHYLLFSVSSYFKLTVTGQAMPPPGGADSGSDDPASESSDTATAETKTYLVMSGGEGYIDFRMGGCNTLHVQVCIYTQQRFLF